MRRLIVLGFERSGGVLLAAVLLTVGAVYGLRFLSLDVSSEGLTVADSPLRAELAQVRAEFGSDQIAVVYAEDPALFTLERLERLREVDRELARLPFVEKVESLFTLPDIRDVGGILETSPLLARIPAEPEALARKQAFGRENPLLRRNVLSPDGTATLLTLYLKPEVLAARPITEIEAELEAVLKPHKEAFAELYQLGRPALQSWLLGALQSDQRILLPLAGLLLFLLLAFNQRSLVAGLLPILNGLLAIVWTLGLMSLLGIPVTLLNYIVPVLVIVVGATEDMHILHEYRTRLAEGASGRIAIEEAGRGIGLALLLTSATTILGFAATAASTLPILRSFGIAAVIGMSARFLISIFVLPAALRPLERVMRGGRTRPLLSPALSRRASRTLVRRLAPRFAPVALGLGLLAAGALHFTREIRLSNDLVSFLDEESTLHQRLEQSSTRLAGSKVLFLTLHDQPGAFLDPVNLRELDAVGEYLRSIPELDTVTSFADIIRRINGQMRGGDPEDAVIPETRAAVRQMLLFARADSFGSYVSPDHARANLVIRSNLNDSHLLNQRAAEIRGELESGRFGPQVFTLTGEALVVASAVDSIVQAQVLSLGGMIGLLFLIVSGLFLSVRCGLLTVLANLFPIVMVFGLMGLTGITLNVGTCMVAAITLGIAIDDTLHLLVRFNRELKTTKREKTAIEKALSHELNPIVSTSLALAGGFLVLAFSSFGPVREFGLLSAGVLLLALVTDVAVTPMLFARTRLITLWDVVGLSLRQRLLRESPFFKDLTAWQAKKIILASQITKAAAGERIIRQGDLGTTLYVVLEGQLEASVGEGAERRLLTRIGVGDVLGEVAIVARMRRSADVTAVVDSRLLTLDAGSLRRLQRFSPFLASRLFLNLAGIIGARLAERIRETAPPIGRKQP
jgi:uncharacterized protein